jgi:GNAT superfamily N-acetyltransferase
MTAYTLRLLVPDDASALRAVRLEALHCFPHSFTAVYATEAAYDEAWFAEHIHEHFIIGAWHEEELVGTACFSPDTRPRNEHKVTLRMVYVRPQHQGHGLARRMIQALIDRYEHQFEQCLLSADAANLPAIRLYESMGWREYGREPHAAKLPDGGYLDDVWMIKFFNR